MSEIRVDAKKLAEILAGQPIEQPLSKNYINKTAAELLMSMNTSYRGYMTKYGKPLGKVYNECYGNLQKDDFFNHEIYNRFADIIEPRAKERWEAIFDHSDFLKRVDTIYGDEKVYPIDIWDAVEENLISSERAETQPTNESYVGVIGKEFKARHIESQYNISFTELLNNLYDPGFEQRLIDKVNTTIANDTLRLAINGQSEDYGSSDITAANRKSGMYKLNTGWLKLAKSSTDSYTTAEGDTVSIGQFGYLRVCNKVNIPDTGDITVYEKEKFSDTEKFVAVDDASLSAVSDALRITKGTTGDDASAVRHGIQIPRGKWGNVTLDITPEDGNAEFKVEVFDSKGDKIGTSAAITGETTKQSLDIPVWTADGGHLTLQIHQYTNSKYIDVENIDITVNYEKWGGQEIEELLDKMLETMHPDLQPKDSKFFMAREHVLALAKHKSSPIYVKDGHVVGVNNQGRDDMRSYGGIVQHRDYLVEAVPYFHSINETKSYGGSDVKGCILFCNEKQLKVYAVTRGMTTDRKFVSRSSSGGAKYEYTWHGYNDFGLGLEAGITIAANGLKAEDVKFFEDTGIKADISSSGEMKGDDGLVPICNTLGAVIIGSETESDLADYKTAIDKVDNADAEIFKSGVPISDSTKDGNAWYFRAFKDGIVLPSDTKSYTFDS